MNIKLIQTTSYGMEVWQVILNGKIEHTYLSEALARTAYMKIWQKLFR